jgi:hypothetical protein
MTIQDRGRVPNEEWVRMYRDGLTAHRIAALTGAPASTVGYHLRLARAADPQLAAAHAGARTSTSRVTSLGRNRLRQLVAMVQATGLYPSRHGATTEERTLATWLQRRREDARAGRLPAEFKEGLAILPDWERPPRAEADEERWLARLEALTAYRAAGNDWPRHKATIRGEEHDLGVWLHAQRSKLRQGQLSADKAAALNAAVPGWRAGRKGGRPAGSTSPWSLTKLAGSPALGTLWWKAKASTGRMSTKGPRLSVRRLGRLPLPRPRLASDTITVIVELHTEARLFGANWSSNGSPNCCTIFVGNRLGLGRRRRGYIDDYRRRRGIRCRCDRLNLHRCLGRQRLCGRIGGLGGTC